MEKMKLIVGNFEHTSSPIPIWSEIYVQMEDIAFPCQQWYDATTSILTMWINAVSKLMTGVEHSITLDFMDGDYFIRLEMYDNKQTVASFYGPNSQLVLHNTIDLLYWGRQLLSAVGKVVELFGVSSKHRAVQEVITTAEVLRTIIRDCKSTK